MRQYETPTIETVKIKLNINILGESILPSVPSESMASGEGGDGPGEFDNF